MLLQNKTVLIGVCGSIASYKIANLCSMLIKLSCNVHVIMTKNATNFINPITFESITKNKCIIDTFDRGFDYNIEHIALAKKADVMIIAPASANMLGKIANGISDDMLSTTVMAMSCPVIIVPAMNTDMFNNKIVQNNIFVLNNYGYIMVEPDSGILACGDIGKGKMPSENILLDYILKEIAYKKDLDGKNILVTAGATIEHLDPVRFISNYSSGKMGYEIAKNCMLRGANVTLVTGRASVPPPNFINTVNVLSAKEMFNATLEAFPINDMIFKVAAVSDYTPSFYNENKIKKKNEELTIHLSKTKDILKHLGEIKTKNQTLCGFSMETENMIENSTKKLQNKNLDMIICNNINVEGAGFDIDTNVCSIITKSNTIDIPIMSKKELANIIVNNALQLHNMQNR